MEDDANDLPSIPRTAPRLIYTPPAPIRFDSEQLVAALKPVVEGIQAMGKVLEAMAPMWLEMGRQLQRMGDAAEAAEERAAMAPRRKR